MENYISSNFPDLVKLIRHPKREGLIIARITGSVAANGSVLTFLDAHCECVIGWIEPILERIGTDPTVVMMPVIEA